MEKALKQLLQVNPKPNISSSKMHKSTSPPPKPNTILPPKPKPDISSRNKLELPAKNPDVKKEVPQSSPPLKPKPDIRRASKRQDYKKEFLQIFKQPTYRHRSWDIWKDFIVMFACTLSNSVDKSRYDEREALYMKTIKRYTKQEQALFPELVAHTVMALEDNFEQDFLGDIFMELNLGNDAGGQFFTPYHVCQLMAEVALGDVAPKVEKEGYITIHDPCCGAGATLIAGIHEARKQLEKVNLNFQNHVLVSAQDIDYTTALMCYIQLSLLGMAGYVKIGNSLTEPMCHGDSLENYWFTPIYFSDVWSTRRLIKRMNSLFEGKETNL